MHNRRRVIDAGGISGRIHPFWDRTSYSAFRIFTIFNSRLSTLNRGVRSLRFHPMLNVACLPGTAPVVCSLGEQAIGGAGFDVSTV
ncbi:MAG: hypothetical protein ABSG80_16815 [Verrucomicrobiota bacterium]|jgi:hypothetical protein